MEDEKNPDASTGGDEGIRPKHDADATSSETLSDIEESTKVSSGASGGDSDSSSSSLEGSSPAPQTEGGGRADGGDTGGLM